MRRIFLAFLVGFLVLFTSCKQAPITFSTEESKSLIREAVIDLNKYVNLEANLSIATVVDGVQNELKSGEFISNSSSEYSVSMTDEESGDKRAIFGRIISNASLYELNISTGLYVRLTRASHPELFDYDYYETNRTLILKIIDQIYNEKNSTFGDFIRDVSFEKEVNDKGNKTVVFAYDNNTETKITNIEQSGEIYVSYYNGEAYVSQVKDTYHVIYKSDGTVLDTITDIHINNVGNAKKIETPNIG